MNLDTTQKTYSLLALAGLASLPFMLGNPTNTMTALGVFLGYSGALIGYSQQTGKVKRSQSQIEALERQTVLKLEGKDRDLQKLASTIQTLNIRLSDKDSQIEETIKQSEGFIGQLEARHKLAIERERIVIQETIDSEVAKLEALNKERSDRFKKFKSGEIKKLQHAIEEKQSLERLLGEVKASQQELLELSDSHIRQIENQVYEFHRELSDKDWKINQLERLLAEVKASKPKSVRFNGCESSSINGNRLIDMFASLGIIAHAHECKSGKDKDTIWLKSDWLITAFTEHKTRIHQAFELLKPPTIELDKGALIKIELPHTQADKAELDIRRYCKPYTDFEELITKWERIKIDGGSEAGKSPTADNLIALKMLQTDGEIVLSNPLSGSKKDYWKIPAKYKTWSEAFTGLSDFVTELRHRTEQARKVQSFPNFPFKLYIFDEIDITLKEAGKKAADKLKEIIKTASHYNMGIVTIGQSPYCSDAGLKRADFNNMVLIHIGKTALNAIALAEYPSDLEAKLREHYLRISDYYTEKNRFIKDTALMYRFALIDDSVNEPFYIELPPFGFYSSVAGECSSQNTVEHPKPETTVNVEFQTVASSNVLPICPNCNSSNTKKNGGSRRLCKECGKTFTATILNSEVLN